MGVMMLDCCFSALLLAEIFPMTNSMSSTIAVRTWLNLFLGTFRPSRNGGRANRKYANHKTRIRKHREEASASFPLKPALPPDAVAIGFSSAGERPCKTFSSETGGFFTYHLFETIDRWSSRPFNPFDIHEDLRKTSYKVSTSEDVFGARLDNEFS